MRRENGNQKSGWATAHPLIHLRSICYGFTGTFFLSTLCPITAPAAPPMTAPIRPPFTLSRLVVAPITAPAVAPIAASRPVFLRVSVRTGAGAEYVPLPDDPPYVVPLLEARRVVVARRGAVVVRLGATVVRVTAGVGVVGASAAFRSSIEMLSMPGAYASPARRRSLSNAASTLFVESSRPHAAARRIAGMITSALTCLMMSTSADWPAVAVMATAVMPGIKAGDVPSADSFPWCLSPQTARLLVKNAPFKANVSHM